MLAPVSELHYQEEDLLELMLESSGLWPAFAANHHWAMARGEESLALELRRRRHPDDPTAVPLPPAATFRRALHRKP
jgi:hypothetical protein